MAIDSNLSDSEIKALAYFAVGVSSEGSVGGRDVSNKLSFAGSMHEGKLHPVGNSGYSFGTLQTDLGQHPEMAPALVSSYQAWAAANQPGWTLTSAQEAQTINDLGRDGHTIKDEHGRPLDATVKAHLDAFMKSDDGISFVHDHDVRQVGQLTRKGDGYKDRGSAVEQLQATSLYKSATVDDQAKLATIMLKLENQSGHAYYPKILKSINEGELKNVDDVKHQVAGILPRSKDNKPSYIEAGMDHALNGANAFLKIRNADPQSDLHQSWQNVIADPLVNPTKAGLDSTKPTLGSDYNAVKEQFLHANGSVQEQKQTAHTSGLLREGARSETVRALQGDLQALGYIDPQVQLNEHYGPATKAAVLAFQLDHGLGQDGVAGPNTLKAIHDQHQVQALGLSALQQPNPASTKSVIPNQGLALDDPRSAFSPNNALYNELKTRIPDASENRLLQFTAACHANKITGENLTIIHLDETNMKIGFHGSSFLSIPATVDLNTPPPQPNQSIQQIQQHDQQQAQMMGQIQAQNTQINQQASQGPAPGSPGR
ncbi:peptidoglycan hydrolase-like protein with peptidoglycan-binding domain [Rhodanobacter sp. ANJX3]|uniref:peptidoglycan-binding protein n=1 Tax=Rhodanobacter sp. ANJX3 TaxID=2723083 RepID=UPI001614A091|nr:peptidoglycan-binding protein [Rhodanobacter sp. ANJX3]MBB5360623.1 peptidoglycan hydrolase-like protein with peptidoglycan-binding domain [Rhodanobacter sp. ANJX3]